MSWHRISPSSDAPPEPHPIPKIGSFVEIAEISGKDREPSVKIGQCYEIAESNEVEEEPGSRRGRIGAVLCRVDDSGHQHDLGTWVAFQTAAYRNAGQPGISWVRLRVIGEVCEASGETSLELMGDALAELKRACS